MTEFIQIFHYPTITGQLPELGSWTYLLLAVLVAVEGPLATLIGAGAASAGLLNPWLVFCTAAIGNLTADLLWYSIGYAGKVEWLFHFGKRLGVERHLMEKMKESIAQHAVKVLFLAKLTVSFVIPSLITAGLLRLPLRKWLPPFVFAESVWTGSLVLIGYFTTEAIRRVERGVEYVILVASVLFVLFLIYMGRRFIKSWENNNHEVASEENG